MQRLTTILFACALCASCGKPEKPAEKPDESTEPGAAPADKQIPEQAAAEPGPGVEPAAGEPAAEQAAAADPTAAAAPEPAKLVKGAADIDWAAIKAAVKAHVGKVALCDNLLAPVPLAVNDFSDKTPLAMVQTPTDDRRTAFFCRTKAGGLDSVPVQVYFPKGDKGQLLHIDRDTVVNVEIRGETGNQVVGVFRGIVSAPRRAVFDGDAPDLFSALLWPERYKGKPFSCRSKMAVSPQAVARFDRDAVEAVGGEVAGQKAMLRCEDKRGGGVSVELYFPAGDEKTVLTLGADTVLTAVLHGFERNQLVAMFQKVDSGAVKAGKGDLKQVLVDPAPHVGKNVACEALVAPQPREIGAIDEGEIKLLKVKLDDRKTSLMCGQPSGGSVAVSLYFKAGEKAQILRMAAKSKIAFSLWGVAHNRLIGVFEKIEAGAIDTKDANDLRAVALSADKFAGKIVPCQINLKPFISGLAYMGDVKTKLLAGEKVADKHAVITCKDASGSLGGTRVEVYFGATDAPVMDELNAGHAIKLRIKGSAFSTLVAIYGGVAKGGVAKGGTP